MSIENYLIKKNNVKEEREYISGGTIGIKIVLQKEEYYIKYREDNTIYTELFYEEIAKYLNIPTINYEIAMVNGQKSLISKNFNPQNEPTKNLYEILKHYKEFMKFHKDLFPSIKIKDNYDLETIWWALLFYYQKNKRKNEIVKKLMNEIIERFLFQIVSFNYDLNYTNIIIIDNESPHLAPNFDCERCGMVGSQEFNTKYALKAISSNIENQTYLDIIEDFINISDEYYVEKLFEYVNQLIELDFNIILKNVEEKIKNQIPAEIKSELINDYDKKLKEIQKLRVLSKTRQKEKK